MNRDINKFTYMLLPPNPVHRPDLISLHDTVYSEWFHFWSQFLEESGQLSLNQDLLGRQNVLAVLMYENSVAATHLYTFFDLRFACSKNHYFFSSLASDGWDFFKQNNVSTFLSMEMLHVASQFRKSKIGFSLAECLIGLGFKYMQAFGFDAAGGTSRSVVKVDKMANNFNLSYQQPGISKMNHDCTYQIGLKDKVKSHPDLFMRGTIDSMWNAKVNLIEEIYNSAHKEAA